MDVILNYFPGLSKRQMYQFEQLESLYKEWNSKINVISRKDIDELYVKHVLHALGIAKVLTFTPGTSILDVGTGGGFPGIPLAILFPECKFHLIDSIQKKIKVVDEVVHAIGLRNVKTTHGRAEDLTGTYDFIVSRAVTAMPVFVSWVKHRVSQEHKNHLKNGILYLKGGDLTAELSDFPQAVSYDLSTYFKEDFFETKKVVYLPLKTEK
ncbi:MAG TPA: 16S rRNA (guanine(527)-N(7))-methyltransferase RsmG [Flavobacteriaceae bacterium]|nr:16S rRNA (guanine(527)-N(7))-methyltransferase RsmG [Flavobacteriaceae bacterium]